MASDRYRNYKFVIWKENLPSNIWDQVDESCLKISISPLHDQDVNNLGVKKKAHYHAIIQFPGKKAQDSAKDIVTDLFGLSVNTVFVCEDAGAYARYFFHLDSPKKHPYPIIHCSDECPEGYREFGGASVEDLMHLASDFRKYDIEIQRFINEYDVRYFDDLSEYCTKVQSEWKTTVNNRSVYWINFLKSRSDRINKNVQPSLVRQIINDFDKKG